MVYSIPTLAMGMVSRPLGAWDLALGLKNIWGLAYGLSERLLWFALSGDTNELVSATQGEVPLEEAAFAIGLVEVVFVQEKKQKLPEQNYYDSGERVWAELGCDS
jgi:hypothetical protein